MALSSTENTNPSGVTCLPDEPIVPTTLGLRVDGFGLDHWHKLFNERQLLSLGVLSTLVGASYKEMLKRELATDYAASISTYLALAVDRLADYNSSLVTWASHGEYVGHTFTSPKLAMVWDYCEVNALSSSTGGFQSALEWIQAVLRNGPVAGSDCQIQVSAKDACEPYNSTFDVVVTDPPYYNSIDYSGLSDFFYVWLKRSVGEINADLFRLPLTPKREQIIMASESNDVEARRFYVNSMATAFKSISGALKSGELFGVVFAHTDPNAWATLIEGLLAANLVPNASWPIDTELQNKTSAALRANLQTSVWMACRQRNTDAHEAFIGDVLEEMRPVVRERLLYFWSKCIRGADFFISAIGPALSVFGRHSRVLRPDGTVVTVRDFLDLVRRESTDVALEQVLAGADLGLVDSLTRQYVTWVWSYSRAPLDAGEAIALCLATGTPYQDVVRPQSIAVEAKEKSKKLSSCAPSGIGHWGTTTLARVLRPARRPS